MTVREAYEKTTRLCSELLKAPSCSGQEAQAAQVLESAMRELGYDEITVDELGNVIGVLRGSRPGRKILLDGHIDTVPVQERERWSFDPFGGEITQDRVCGRGASDMKGAVAAMTVAAAAYAENCSRDFPGEIYVAGVVYEELFEGIASRQISEFVQPDYVIIGESTHLNLKIGQRGRAELVAETIGKPAHSANPEKGVNAVKKMMKLLAALEDYVPREQEGLGKAIMELTDIISEPFPGSSVLPQRCIATFDRRLLVGDTPDSVLEPIREAICRLSAEDPDFQAKTYVREKTMPCYTGGQISAQRFFPAWMFSREDNFVKASYEALCSVEGIEPIITAYSFCTNGSHYAGEKGIRTVGFGPSLESLAHTVDEYVLIEQLEKSTDGYQKLIHALLYLDE